MDNHTTPIIPTPNDLTDKIYERFNIAAAAESVKQFAYAAGNYGAAHHIAVLYDEPELAEHAHNKKLNALIADAEQIGHNAKAGESRRDLAAERYNQLALCETGWAGETSGKVAKAHYTLAAEMYRMAAHHQKNEDGNHTPQSRVYAAHAANLEEHAAAIAEAIASGLCD